MSVSEKVAYLKGLADGVGLTADKDEGKIIAAIIDALEDIAQELDALRGTTDDLSDQLDYLAEDLTDLEDAFYGDEDEEEDEDAYPRSYRGRCCETDDDDDDCCCGHEDYTYEITCPNCDAEFEIDDEDLSRGSIVCPGCGETIELEYDDEDDDACCEDISEEDADDETSGDQE